MIKTVDDIKNALLSSEYHLKALRILAAHADGEYYIAAGFVRNHIWDVANNFRNHTPLNDLDVIYFDPHDLSETTEQALEAKLLSDAPEYPWSVKNQARMHIRNNEPAYKDINDALCRWCETVTPIGARLDKNENIELIYPLGIGDLITGQCHATPHALGSTAKHQQYIDRMKAKAWQDIWPSVTVHDLNLVKTA